MVVSPDVTIARVRALAPEVGITRVGNVTGLDYIGIPVAVAVRPASKSVSVSQGKGVTRDHAVASALMECAELFHAEHLTLPRRRATIREIRTEQPFDVRELGPMKQEVSDDTVVPWVEGWDLIAEKRAWVPSEILDMDYAAADRQEIFVSTSNGLASGNHVCEAMSAGICELVERDAIAVWQARGVLERAAHVLDLASVEDPVCAGLLDRYRSAGVVVRVWDVTSDIGIPVFVCEIRSGRDNPSEIGRRFRGAGCHPDPALALSRALTEAAQARLTFIVGIRNDIPAEAYAETPTQTAGGLLLDALAAQAQGRSFSARDGFRSNDISAEARWELQQLRLAGFHNAIAVDLTRSEFGLPVVRMVIPGLEGDPADPRYLAGRRARAARGQPS